MLVIVLYNLLVCLNTKFNFIKVTFFQKLWKYDKIDDSNKMKKTRFADIN